MSGSVAVSADRLECELIDAEKTSSQPATRVRLAPGMPEQRATSPEAARSWAAEHGSMVSGSVAGSPDSLECELIDAEKTGSQPATRVRVAPGMPEQRATGPEAARSWAAEHGSIVSGSVRVRQTGSSAS